MRMTRTMTQAMRMMTMKACQRPARTRGSIRQIGPIERHGHHDLRARPRPRAHAEPPADQRRPLAHARKPEPCRRWQLCRRRWRQRLRVASALCDCTDDAACEGARADVLRCRARLRRRIQPRSGCRQRAGARADGRARASPGAIRVSKPRPSSAMVRRAWRPLRVSVHLHFLRGRVPSHVGQRFRAMRYSSSSMCDGSDRSSRDSTWTRTPVSEAISRPSAISASPSGRAFSGDPRRSRSERRAFVEARSRHRQRALQLRAGLPCVTPPIAASMCRPMA